MAAWLYCYELTRHKVSAIGADNIVLDGLSQGCAASMVAMLAWDGPPLRAMIATHVRMIAIQINRSKILQTLLHQMNEETPVQWSSSKQMTLEKMALTSALEHCGQFIKIQCRF